MVMKRKLYLLKLGGSIITDVSKRSTPLHDEVRRILGEIKEAKESQDFDIIIGHGSGSFAHIPAKEYKVNEGLVNENSRKGSSITQQVAQELNRIIIEEGTKLGLNTFQFAPSSFAMAENGTLVEGTTAHIKEALGSGFVPVVYGDVVIDRKKGVCIASTEKVFEFLAKNFEVDKVIMATDVDGVFDKNPTEENAKLIESIDGSNINDVTQSTGTNASRVDVTGGMRTKVLGVYEMVRRSGNAGVIINGKVQGRIRDALLGKDVVGTVVAP